MYLVHLVTHMVGNWLNLLVGRDGIEPPTPGFSVLSINNNTAHLY